MSEFVSEHIRITLSLLAHKILENDCILFGASANSNLSYGTLINRILENFDDDFALDENLLKLQCEELSSTVRLRNDVIDILGGVDVKTYLKNTPSPKVTKYVKCLLETFARLPFIEREKLILKKNIIQNIENALKNQKNLELLYTGKAHFLTPICIATSKEGSFQYLIGEENASRVSFRLSRIEKIRAKGKAPILSKQTKYKILEDLSEFGATFITEPVITIKVKFTEKGLKSYEYSVIHRPIHVAKEDDNILVFHCSERQALYFFFRFAGDAEIMEPQSLRDKFRDLYRAGLSNYT